MIEKEGDKEQSVPLYREAIDLFVAENQTSEANKCRLKVAQTEAEAERYEEAIEVFEEVARGSVENNLLKFGAKDHLLNAMLCRLAYQGPEECREAMERYEDIDISFEGSRQHKLANDVLSALEPPDVQSFTDVVGEYDRLTKLDPWRTSMLLRVKRRVEGGGTAAGEEEEEEFT